MTGAVAPLQVGPRECVEGPLTELGLHHPLGLAAASEAMLGTELSGGGSRRNEGHTEHGQLTEESAGSGACVLCRDAHGPDQGIGRPPRYHPASPWRPFEASETHRNRLGDGQIREIPGMARIERGFAMKLRRDILIPCLCAKL